METKKLLLNEGIKKTLEHFNAYYSKIYFLIKIFQKM